MIKNLVNYFLLFILLNQFILIKSEDSVEGEEENISQISIAVDHFITGDYKTNGINELSSEDGKGGKLYKYTNDKNYYYLISYVDKQAGFDDSIEYPKVIISDDCIKKIKSENENDDDIIVEKIFRKVENDDNNEAGITDITDIIYYKFYYLPKDPATIGASIDVKMKCGKVTFYLPIYTEDNSLKYKYNSVSGQNPDSDIDDLKNYDIFYPDAKIYKDICATITFSISSENIVDQDSFSNYDITLHERRKYYFPGNTALCPDNFNYLGVDRNSFSSMCQGNAQIYGDDAQKPYEAHKFSSFNADSKFKSAKRDIYFSMDVLKCVKLPFTKKGFKGNYGNYFMLIIISIVIVCYIILLLTGKYHLLSVLELLYNSNIKSMNYLKGSALNNQQGNNTNQIIPYDVKSNNNLGATHQTTISNGQLMSNVLSGNNYLYYQNQDKLSTSKKSNNNNKKNDKDKKEIMSNVDEQENDYESERDNEEKDKTKIHDKKNKDVKILDVKSKNRKKEKEKTNKKEEKSSNNSNESDEQEDEDDNDNESYEESESKSNNKSKNKKKKSNPPKKKTANGGENSDSDSEEEEEEEKSVKKNKKKKSKKPIEISLNVKDLRDMMLKEQQAKSENVKIDNKKEKKNKSKSNKKNNNNFLQNGFPFPPYMPPMGMMPYGMPPYMYPNMNNRASSSNNNNNNSSNSRIKAETEKLKRELEYQKELNERRERELKREREDMLERERERERQKQRENDLDKERRLKELEMKYTNKGEMERFENILKKYNNNNSKTTVKRGSALWNDDSDVLTKEREKFNLEQDKFNKVKEKLEEEIEKKKEENEKIQKDLNILKEEQKLKQVEFEKELLKSNKELKEQFEKEKKEIIETKNREIQLLKEDKDREIQRLKEDKDKEIESLKKDMEKQIKKKDDKIKKKEKVIEKQKKETKELKKDLTTNNTFYTNNIGSTLRYNNLDVNGYKKEEKIEAPQVVVSISSIFTDQELNAMDFEQSCQFDKRTLCQVYLSFINRKQPLFFFFNYNSSSSGISIFQINYQTIRFIIICIDFMVYMFIYCTFFGTKSITFIYKGKFNFRRMCILGIIISPFCLIIRSIIHHFVYDPMNKKIAEIKMRCYTNFTVGKKKEELKVNEFKDFWESDGGEEKNKEEIEKKEEIDEIQDIENDDNLSEGEKAKRKDKYEKRILKLLIKDVIALFQKKVLISFIIMLVVLLFEWIYVSSFCAVYKNSQLKFFVSIIVCYGFANLIPFVYCLVPTILKVDAVRDESNFSFFLANVFQLI